MSASPNKDNKFLMVCLKCVKSGKGMVNHEYKPMSWGLRITYHCFECGETEVKDLVWGLDVTPTTKGEMKNKLGIKKQIIN